MTVTVFFVRHAAHDRLGKVLCGRMPGVHLGSEGRRQARALADRFRGEALSAVFTSPLERARETASLIAEACGLPVQCADQLNEIDFGAWTGAAFAELERRPGWSDWNRHRAAACPPSGEAMTAVRLRLRQWLDAVAEERAGQAVAAVSHADVIKTVVGDVLGLSPDHHQKFEVSPASISVVVKGGWGAKVQSINEAPR